MTTQERQAALSGVKAHAAMVSGWWPAGPPSFAPRRRYARAPGRRRPDAQVRLVVETTAVAAAVAGILVFRQQGTPTGAGVNLFTSAVPVLIAVPAVIVVLRIYPLVLRACRRWRWSWR